jgi:hypothetical protein
MHREFARREEKGEFDELYWPKPKNLPGLIEGPLEQPEEYQVRSNRLRTNSGDGTFHLESGGGSSRKKDCNATMGENYQQWRW